MNTTMLALVAHEAREAAEPFSEFELQAKAAFKAAKNHFMVRDENEQFQGACCGLYEIADEDTRERIKDELLSLKTVSAMLSGVPVDFGSVKPLERPLGLMRLWRETEA